jgi:predicted DNA-binding transcriptional regulator AlpA
MRRFLSYAELEPKGIKYSKPHLWRLIKEKKFPAPVKGLGVENCWAEDLIDKYIAGRVAAARDAEMAVA